MSDLLNKNPLNKYLGVIMMCRVEDLLLDLGKPAYGSTSCQTGVTATKGWDTHITKECSHIHTKKHHKHHNSRCLDPITKTEA